MDVLPLADEFFLVGHDPRSGRPLGPARMLDAGLAGALLIELIQAGRIKVDEHEMVTVLDQRPYGERVTDAALGEILKEHRTKPVRTWVGHLRGHARIMVASRLVRTGLISPVPGRGLTGRTKLYPSADRPEAFAPLARLRHLLEHPDLPGAQTAALAALVLVTGLEAVVAGDFAAKTARAALAQMRQSLPSDLEPVITAAAGRRDRVPPSAPRHSAP